MEQNYVFMTDSDSDLPFHLKEQYNIPVVYMPYALDGRSILMIWARWWITRAITT